MKLHYSQTFVARHRKYCLVLLPYEITLLSNASSCSCSFFSVLLPYEITLLSNTNGNLIAEDVVLLPYEITLLSNSHKDPPIP